MKLVRESLLFEGMAEREPALRSKFRTIDDNAFDAIVKLGYGNPQLVPYIDWLLSLCKSGKLKLEDLYKAEEYLLLFSRQSVKNRVDRKDINQYEDLVDLYGAIEPFKESEEILSDNEIKEKSLIKVFKNYSLFIPRSYEDSCILGAGTEWCTASGKTKEWYNKYTKKNKKLFIFINIKDPKEKFQLEFYSRQFMDRNDKEVDFFSWLSNNTDIKLWLKQNYEDEMIFFSGIEDIHVNRKRLTTLVGLNFPKNIRGNFVCSENRLTTLEGAPEIVIGDFWCSRNELTSLKGAPLKIWESFSCYRNNLINLIGAPQYVGGSFNCASNKLTTLEGAPENVSGDFSCSKNWLKTLKGAPQYVEGNFSCSENRLTTLDGAPQYVGGSFNCASNNLTKEEIEDYRKTGAVKGRIIG